MNKTQIESIKKNFVNIIKFEDDFPVSKYCTLHAGGQAKLFCRIFDEKLLRELLQYLLQNQINFRLVGSLSNILVSDKGFDGLIIQNKTEQIELLPLPNSFSFQEKYVPPRLEQKHASEFFSIDGLDYDHSSYPLQIVRISSGYTLVKAAFQLLKHQVVGLEMFSGIPGTIGGALYTNAHGGHRYFGNLVIGANCLDKNGTPIYLNHNDFDFDYDYSSLQENLHFVLNVDLALRIGDTQKAKNIAKEWANRKSLQPQLSLGSVFQNLTPEQVTKHNLPTSSTGYVIDKILHLRGKLQIGGMIVSAESANIIKNLGSGTASEYFQLVKTIKAKALSDANIELHEEVQFLGDFD